MTATPQTPSHESQSHLHPDDLPPDMSTRRGSGGIPETAGDAGGVPVFAAVVLITAGLLHIVQAMAAFGSNTLLVAAGTYVFAYTLGTWAWAHVIGGALTVLVGAALLTGAGWARWTAVVLAGLALIGNFLWLPYYPLWALVVIALDVLVIWSLTAHTTARRAGARAA